MARWLYALELAAFVLAACGQAKHTKPDPTPVLRVPKSNPGAQLPPNVLARAIGSQGVIQVEETDGMRLLTIDGMIQAAVPIDAVGSAIARDPVVPVIESLRPAARTALVIGLGSGQTAMNLAAADFRVETAELEQAVIDMARTYFGFTGSAVAQDGRRFLQKTRKHYDVIVVDAFWGVAPPEEMVTDSAFLLMRSRLTNDGIIAVRLVGSPRQANVRRVRDRLRSALRSPFVHVFGSGVGLESQNLYVVASSKPLNFANRPGVPLWPVHTSEQIAAWAEPTRAPSELDVVEAKPTRAIALVGYLVELREDGSLALDLPHKDIGATRYVINGPNAASLRAMLPPRGVYPTEGDIQSDGDVSKTLAHVLGGSGVKRSDLRFSPFVAAVEGRATLRSVVHADSATSVPLSLREDADIDKRLPYGGSLYDLEVTRVHWVLDQLAWEAMRAPLQPELAAAIQSIDGDDPRAAAKPLVAYTSALRLAFAPFADRLVSYRTMASLRTRLLEATATTPNAELALARACDVAAGKGGQKHPSADFSLVRQALLRCARRHYEAACADPRAPGATAAASRLLFHLEAAADDTAIREINARFPDLEPAESPPELP